jgi:ubiquinone/menaquinone biosynthesis C-methylase UbiE
MTDDIFFEIHTGLPREGPGRDQYTERAFRMLPHIEKPDILDIGCGPGGPTITLARMSGGRITGLDNHQPYLDRLEERARDEGLSDRVRALHGSMFAIPFPEGSFDVVWAEGAIYIVGFERGLNDWRRFLKPHGFLVVHEMTWLQPDPPREILDYWKKFYPGIASVENNLQTISRCGYDVIEHFTLPEDAWWAEYYGPLEERISQLRKKYAGNTAALEALDNEQREIDMYRKYQSWYGSVFFVLQKQ